MGKLIVILLFIATPCLAAWPNTELDCLSSNIYYEARGESIHGQWAVAYVTQNRVRSTKYPNTYCQVVKQPWQFSWWNSKPTNRPNDPWSWQTAQNIASYFIQQAPIVSYDPTEGAMFYHANYVNPKWILTKQFLGRIGKHLFYK